MNWLRRKIAAWRFARALDRSLAERKRIRQSGMIPVSGHARRRT